MVTAITSAFGDPTRRGIYLYVHGLDQGATASDVASHFDLHPNVARHHLDKLAGGGYLHVKVQRSTSGAGRPSKHYLASSAPDGLGLPLGLGPMRIGSPGGNPNPSNPNPSNPKPGDQKPSEQKPSDLAEGNPADGDTAGGNPVRRDPVLITLLGRALAALDPADAEALATEVGYDYGRALARNMGDAADQHRSMRSALQAVAEALTAQGFAAHTETRANGTGSGGTRAGETHTGQMHIVSEHCPFAEAVAANPVICAVDRGMVAGLVSQLLGTAPGETTVALQASRPMGDDRCVTAVGP